MGKNWIRFHQPFSRKFSVFVQDTSEPQPSPGVTQERNKYRIHVFFFSVKDRNLFHRVDTIGNILLKICLGSLFRSMIKCSKQIDSKKIFFYKDRLIFGLDDPVANMSIRHVYYASGAREKTYPLKRVSFLPCIFKCVGTFSELSTKSSQILD